MAECKECAIAVRNISFGYEQRNQNNLVLNSVNISATKGEIYGLLGPSGCGKTTLIKLIIGLLQPKSGEVSVFGYKPGTRESGTPGIGVGHMPQEISLPMLFTINEAFQYFGKIYLLDNEIIDTQMKNFLNAFGLTNANEMICNLSGGEQRKVSLAIALFSLPRLIILDEPTVGVDPLLRNSIWSFLRNLTKERNTTIIVTTHYIEEIRCADTVAIMRRGDILIEANPNYIIQSNNCLNLEEAYLMLCTESKQIKKKRSLGFKTRNGNGENGAKTSGNISEIGIVANRAAVIDEPLNNERYLNQLHQNLKLLKVVNWKILRTNFRQPGPLFAFCSPILSALILIHCLGTLPENGSVGWIVDDLPNTNSSMHLETPFLPDVLLGVLNTSKMFEVVKYNTKEDAMKVAKKLKIIGFIHLKENFSNAFYERDLFLNDDIISNGTLDAGSVHFSVDTTIKPLFEIYKHELFKIIQKFREEAYEAIGVYSNMSLLPMQIGEPIYPSPERDGYSLRTHTSIITMYLCSYFGFSVAATAIPLLLDIKDEVYSRLFSAGVKPYHLLFGEIFAQFLLMSLSATLSLFIMLFVYNVPCRGQIIFAVTNVFLQILSGVSLGALLAVTIRTPFNCHIFIYAVFSEAVLVSDAMWPTITAPYFMKLILPFTPVHFQTIASQKIFNYPDCNFVRDILPAFTSSICYTLVSLLIACVVLKRNK